MAFFTDPEKVGNELMENPRVRQMGAFFSVCTQFLLQKSKSAMFDGCNPLKYLDMIFDKSVKNWFLQQNPLGQVGGSMA
jgi:hypothetical protein